MTRRLALLALVGAALALRSDRAPADLDVAVPPGTASDWLRGLPRPVLTGAAETRLPVRGRPGGDGGSVEMVPRTRFRVPSGATGFSGITTVDMPSHLPWARPIAIKARRPVAMTGPSSDPADRRVYPPPPSHPLQWLALASILRTNLKPASISVVDAREQLILLGEPALVAARRAAREKSLARLARAVIRAVGPIDRAPPSIPRGDDAYASMMLRMAVSELASGHPYAPDRPFAPRLRGLGHAGLAPVLALTRHKHRFLRRNAVAMLASYDTPAALGRLRELIGDKDKVVRNRAIAALAARGDREAVPLLLPLIRGEAGRASLAIDAIGRSGLASAAAPLRELLAKSRSKPDLLWALIPALARCCSDADNDSPPALRELSEFLRVKPNRYPSAKPTWQPDRGDRWTKAQVLYQMSLFGLARIGDRGGVEQTFELLEGKVSMPASSPLAKVEEEMRGLRRTIDQLMVDIRGTNGAEYRRLVGALRKHQARYRALLAELKRLGGSHRKQMTESPRGTVTRYIAPAARFLLIEALAQHDEGHRWLAKIVQDETEWTSVRLEAARVIALEKSGLTEEPAAILVRWATHADTPSAVRAAALQRLLPMDAAKAARAAQTIVEAWQKLAPETLPSQRHWVVVSALDVLGRTKSSTTPLLVAVAERAWRERLAARAAREKLARQNAGMASLAAHIHRVPETFEVALLELGRAADGKGLDALARRLADASQPGRYAAAVALAGAGQGDAGKRVATIALGLLGDRDPWVRYGAYRALRALPGAPDHTGDWLYGKAADRASAIAAWTTWVGERWP